MSTFTLANETTSVELEGTETESVITNANVNVTIGGIPKSQADTRRLKIILDILCAQSDSAALMAIIDAYTEEITYTPSRLLFGKSSIADIVVSIVNTPDVEIRGVDGDLYYNVRLECEEVINA